MHTVKRSSAIYMELLQTLRELCFLSLEKGVTYLSSGICWEPFYSVYNMYNLLMYSFSKTNHYLNLPALQNFLTLAIGVDTEKEFVFAYKRKRKAKKPRFPAQWIPDSDCSKAFPKHEINMIPVGALVTRVSVFRIVLKDQGLTRITKYNV